MTVPANAVPRLGADGPPFKAGTVIFTHTSPGGRTDKVREARTSRDRGGRLPGERAALLNLGENYGM